MYNINNIMIFFSFCEILCRDFSMGMNSVKMFFHVFQHWKYAVRKNLGAKRSETVQCALFCETMEHNAFSSL